MKSKLRLIVAMTRYSWQIDSAYFSDLMLKPIHSAANAIAALIFILITFNQTDTLLGYSANQMLFVFLLYGAAFYISELVIGSNAQELKTDVASGNFDFVLIRPISSLFQVSIRNLSILKLICGVAPAIVIYAIMIDWSQLGITWLTFWCGSIIFVCGLLAQRVFQLLCTIIVFWTGYVQEPVFIVYHAMTKQMVWESQPHWFRLVFTTIIPTAIVHALSASVFLGKFTALPATIFAILVAVSLLGIERYAWAKALRAYSSASS